MEKGPILYGIIVDERESDLRFLLRGGPCNALTSKALFLFRTFPCLGGQHGLVRRSLTQS